MKNLTFITKPNLYITLLVSLIIAIGLLGVSYANYSSRQVKQVGNTDSSKINTIEPTQENNQSVESDPTEPDQVNNSDPQLTPNVGTNPPKTSGSSNTKKDPDSPTQETSCPSGQTGTPPNCTTPPSGPSGKRCVINLHGKGGSGGATYTSGGITFISPTGNGDGGGWGPAHWEYPSESNYQAALSIIVNAANSQSCGQIALIGFSNGAAMAAKMYCRGYTFNGKLLGVIVDDPVPDQTVASCSPGSGVSLRLVQSNDMLWLTDGAACPGGWTCQGTMYSRATYQNRIGRSADLITPSHSPANGSYAGWYNPWWN